MKIVQEVVPNHTSRRHPWFQQSHQSTVGNFTDFYIWDDGRRVTNTTRAPPSNWVTSLLSIDTYTHCHSLIPR